MTAFLASYNVSDFDDSYEELVGVYSTREKALAGIEKDRAAHVRDGRRSRKKTPLLGVDLIPSDHYDCYAIVEVPVDPE